MSQLDLKLPENTRPATTPRSSSPVLWRCFLSAGILVTAIGVWFPRENHAKPKVQLQDSERHGVAELGFNEDLLLRLSKAGAWNEASALLNQAIVHPELDAQRRAELLLKDATYQSYGENHEKALAQLYRADMLNQDDELERKINQKIIDTLRAMGKYDVIGHELSAKNRERKDGDAKHKDPVVATVDGENILLSDLRHQVELEIKRRLQQAQMANPDADQSETMEQELRKQLAAPGEQYRLLQAHVSQKVLEREALAWKLDQHPDFLSQMEDLRSKLLGQLLIQTKVEPGPIADMDLKNYIESHRAELGLSTDAGQLSPADIQKATPQARLAYTEEKRQENQSLFQKSLMDRHKVEIFRDAFTEGAK